MLFSSYQFFIFLPIVLALYFALPKKYTWALLLGASYYFYMCWNPKYIILIIISTLIDYAAGILMGAKNTKKERLPFLILSLISNLGILITFKYLDFFQESFHLLTQILGFKTSYGPLNLLLPMGISFYTFQTMSYSIDVYRGDLKAEKHLGRFALFVTFFPQLVAGPIERAGNLLGQLRYKNEFSATNFKEGSYKMLWGLFKKIVIADRLSVMVEAIYGQPELVDGAHIWIASYFFAFQIYCDFSGYSDIAIGVAKMMGYNLMENFKMPYFSSSISEFWGRWHISLSTWFRDYLYIPLGGNRVGKKKWFFNLFITFFISGLWHGANWTFIAWGTLHGAYLITGILISPWINKIKPYFACHSFYTRVFNLLSVLLIFHLVVVGWVFFRANSFTNAILLLKKAGTFNESFAISNFDVSTLYFWQSCFFIVLLLGIEFVSIYFRSVLDVIKKSNFLSKISMLILLILILIFGVWNSNNFIYFQF